MNDYPLLTLLVFLPFVGSMLVLLCWRREAWCRPLALAFSVLEFGLTGWLCAVAPGLSAGGTTLPGFFLVEDFPWIERFGIRYTLGMDGISLLLALLTAFIIFVAVFTSRTAAIKHAAAYHAALLLVTTGVMGVFLALDLFLFYLFWEVMLLPVFFLICIWGKGRPIYSAVKFFIFTLAGSLLMLLAVIGLYLIHGGQTGKYTFALADLLHTGMTPSQSFWLFGAFLLAFAVKVPLFPLHSWLPDAYTDAPVSGSLILSALLAKTGVYGLLRFAFPLFPTAAVLFAPVLLTLAVVSILYGSWIAYAQHDMKRLVAYSSFGHMGFIVLGIAAWTPVSLSGSVLQMVNHGITTGGLFVLLGMLEERTRHNEMDALGGLWGKVPNFSAFFLLFSLAAVGLPGLNNFAGEFLVLVGAFRVSPWLSGAAFCGIVPILIYMLRMVQKVLFNREDHPLVLPDIAWRDGLILAIFAVLIVMLGVYPVPLLDLINEPVQLLTTVPGGMP